VGNTNQTTLESSSTTNETTPHSPTNANENDDEDAKESSLESLESELSALQNTDDELLTNEEFAAKMEKEQELEQEEEEELESLVEEGGVGVWDDEYVDDDGGDDLGGVMNADELKEELKEVNQEIAGAFFFFERGYFSFLLLRSCCCCCCCCCVLPLFDHLLFHVNNALWTQRVFMFRSRFCCATVIQSADLQRIIYLFTDHMP
jgi:hypothetical protein